jgi:Tfp pilus assembly protein PilV
MNKMTKRYKKMSKNNKESGIALVEVIAALGIAVVVITSLVALSLSTMRASLKSKLLLEGSKIASREVELVRAFRDNSPSWADFLAITGCTSLNPCSMYADGSGINTSGPTTEGSGTEILTRSLTATDTKGDGSIIRISVSVVWSVGNENHGSYIQTDLTNWRGR